MTEHRWKQRWLVSLSYDLPAKNPNSHAYAAAVKKGHTPMETYGEVQSFATEEEAVHAIRWARNNPDKWAPPGAVNPTVSSALRQVIKPGGTS